MSQIKQRRLGWSMSIEGTNACNLNCSSCGSPHGHDFMTPRTFEKILLHLHSVRTRKGDKLISLHWRGEPCLSPHLPDIAEYATALGHPTYVSTNTVVPLLSDKSYVTKLLNNITRLNVSVDGYNQKTLSAYRGENASWKLLLKNLKTISEASTDCIKEMRVLMFKYNEGHEGFYRKLAQKYNMTNISFARPIINYKMKLTDYEAEKWLAEDPKYQRYRKIKDVWRLKRGGCMMLRRNTPPTISVHGTVHPCGNDWSLQYNLGNVLDTAWPLILKRFKEMKPAMKRRELLMCKTMCCSSRERVDFRERV